MHKQYNLNRQILKFWENLAVSKPSGKLVTHSDLNQVSIEINSILKMLNRNDVLLDIGCGNGFSSSIYAAKCSKITGVDYSANMINAANHAYKRKNIVFEEGDVLSLPYKEGSFSAAVSTRCLINLTGWNRQKKAILNISNVLKKGGRLILTEGMRQGRGRLNKLRNKMGLPSMPRVWHNFDFDEDKLMPFLSRHFIIKDDIRFGIYDVLTRVIYPAVISPKKPEYGTDYHRLAEKLIYLVDENSLRQYSREACLVLVKK
jgi:ubiquinone/menaquinone biosynthesis C-methylase UbiE